MDKLVDLILKYSTKISNLLKKFTATNLSNLPEEKKSFFLFIFDKKQFYFTRNFFRNSIFFNQLTF